MSNSAKSCIISITFLKFLTCSDITGDVNEFMPTQVMSEIDIYDNIL